MGTFRDTCRQVLRSRVQDRFGDTPLAEIGQQLECALREEPDPNDWQLEYAVTDALHVLPLSFGARFKFDAALIQAIVDTWSSEALPLSAMIVPRCDHFWMSSRVPMPRCESDAQASPPRHTHVVDVIHLRGQDNEDTVDLLSYPWLCHELGHCVLARPESTFILDFQVRLNELLATTDMAALAQAYPPVRDIDEIIEALKSHWRPTPLQYDWPHELAADTIAVWTSGPAFIHMFEDYAQRNPEDRAIFRYPHPPDFLRAQALIVAAEKLGWGKAAGALKAIVDGQQGSTAFGAADRFRHPFYQGLAELAVDVALGMCQALNLPRCDSTHEADARVAAKDGQPPEFGVELLLLARFFLQHHGKKKYRQWERKTFRALANLVTLVPRAEAGAKTSGPS